MDVSLVTSPRRSEGTPTTAIEAMACGVPMVACDGGAVRDVVDHGVTGILVPPTDPGSTAPAIQKLIDDPGLRLRMAEAGRRVAVERFDVSVCVNVINNGLNSAVLHHQRAVPLSDPV